MNLYYNKFLTLIIVFILSKDQVYAKPLIDESILESIDSVSWIKPIRNLGEDGSIIAWISKNPTAIPLIYPKLVPLFEFMDKGNPKFYTLKQLSLNPRLVPRPVFQEEKKKIYIEQKDSVEKTKVESLENRLRELEAKLLSSQAKIKYRPNDDELKAFILEGNEHLNPEKRMEYLSQVIAEAKKKTGSEKNVLNQNNKPEWSKVVSSSNEIPPSEFLSIPEPPAFDEPEEERPYIDYSSSPLKSVLKFKASVPTPQGTERPAQASDFYLTTQNLHDLLGDLNLNQALAGEVKSVAEIWANAEKDSSINPEIALDVKSILFQAKVGKTRTNPFGEAEMDGVSPDGGYFLIGIDKDDQTGVVTIWSKPVEVSPGENMVELTANDVIYHE